MYKILAKLIFLILLLSLFGCERESATDRGKIILKILVPEEKKNAVKQISVVVKPYILQEDKESLEIIRQAVSFGEKAELKFISEKKFTPENVFFTSAPITSSSDFQNSCSFYTQRCGTILSVCDSLSCEDYISFNINFAEESKEGITMQVNQQEFLVLQRELILDLPVYEDAKPHSVDVFIGDDAGNFKVWRRNFYVVSPGQVVFIKIDELDLSLFYKDADGDGIGGEPIVSYESEMGSGITTVGGDLDDSNPYILGLDDTILFEDKDRDFYPSGNTKSIKEFLKKEVRSGFANKIKQILLLIKQEVGVSSDVKSALELAQKSGFYPADKLKSITELDCDDNDPTVYPGAPINCDDSKDNNCDGIIEFWAYTDQDGDRYAPNSVSVCLAMTYPGFITVGSEIAIGDIDDRDPSVNVPTGVGVCDGPDKIWAYIDKDGDKYSPTSVSFCVETTSVGYTPASEILGFSDCDDNSVLINPSSTEICDGRDNNCDGNIDEVFVNKGKICSVGIGECQRYGVYVCSGDGTTTVCDASPGTPSTEICDGKDNDCDGEIDEGVKTTFYRDADGDGYGYSGETTQACSAPPGYVSNSGDCNDSNASIKPGATEVCDGVDNNCDGQIDEGVKTIFYKDADGDGYGSPSSTTQACSAPPGYVSNSGDCNDSNASIKPGATEVCDGVDNNCDGQIDEGVKTIFYKDADGDGYGSPSSTTQACSQPSGYVSNSGDCNDSNASIKPGATEICDGVDNNCDGQIDEGVKTTFYRDADGDGYGSPSSTTQACSQPSGYVSNSADCDDTNASINPETVWYKDADGDGYSDGATVVQCSRPSGYKLPSELTSTSGDCDDGNPSLNPQTVWYKDADSDGYYPSGGSQVSCSDPYPENSTYTALNPGDCDDGNPNIHPGAPLNCNNSQDNDCDGNVEKWFFQDQDSDTWTTSISQCANTMPSGFTSTSKPLDCNDSNASIKPGATEICDGVDNNCDGQIDEGASCGVPVCPTSLTATYFFRSSTGDISIKLEWNDPATNETGFVVEKSKKSSFFPSITYVINSPNTTTFTLDFEEPLTRFWFRVWAFNSTGPCTPIAISSVFTPPGLLWAYSLTSIAQDQNGYPIHPKIFDLNGDGKKEVIMSDSEGRVYAISTTEFNLEISAIPLWIIRPAGNKKFTTNSIAVFQGNATVIAINQQVFRSYIIDKNGNITGNIVIGTTPPYHAVITDINFDLLPDFIVSLKNQVKAFDFFGNNLFTADPPGAEVIGTPTALIEYKGKTTTYVVGTNTRKIRFYEGNNQISVIDLTLQPFSGGVPSFISTFKKGALSRAVVGTDTDIFITNLIKNPLLTFNTNAQVIATPLFFDFSGDGITDVAITSGNFLRIINGATGLEICSFNLGANTDSSPVLLPTTPVQILVGANNGILYSISPSCTQNWQYNAGLGFQIKSTPLSANLDSNSNIEIIFTATSATSGKIVILDSSGNLIKEFSDLVNIGPTVSSPRAGDIDGNGVTDVVIGGSKVIGTQGGIYIVTCGTDCSSANPKKFSKSGWSEIKTTPLLYDLNSDGYLDIVVADTGNNMYAISGTSINYSEPYLLWQDNLTKIGETPPGVVFPSSPTVFLKGSTSYIAIGSNGQGIYIIRGNDGSAQNIGICNTTFSSPATFDYNRDGIADLVFGCDNKFVYIISGSDFSVLRKEKVGDKVRGSPKIYDFDGDGVQDIGIGSDDKNIYVFNGERTFICSFPTPVQNQPAIFRDKIIFSDSSNLYVLNSDNCIAVAQKNGVSLSPSSSCGVFYETAGGKEILICGDETNGEILVMDSALNDIFPFPFTFASATFFSSPAIDDIDGDSSLEFVISSQDMVFAYRLTNSEFERLWGEFSHDRYNSSFKEQKEVSYLSPNISVSKIKVPDLHESESKGCSTSMPYFSTMIITLSYLIFRRRKNL